MCLESCNRGLNPTIVEDAFTDPRKEWTNSPELLPLLDIVEEEFQRAFADLEWHQSSPQLLKRNVLVALGNLRDPVAVPALVRMLDDPDPMLRGHAAWALGRMGGDEIAAALMERSGKEEDARVREEIELALKALAA
jgi:epoxyqueuosine reductase